MRYSNLPALRCKLATSSLMVERRFLPIKRGDAPPLLLTDRYVHVCIYSLSTALRGRVISCIEHKLAQKNSILPTKALAGCRFIPEVLESLLLLQFSTILKVGWKNCPVASFSPLLVLIFCGLLGCLFCIAGLCPVKSVFWRRVLWAGVSQLALDIW